jgi:hypothetical protein
MHILLPTQSLNNGGPDLKQELLQIPVQIPVQPRQIPLRPPPHKLPLYKVLYLVLAGWLRISVLFPFAIVPFFMVAFITSDTTIGYCQINSVEQISSVKYGDNDNDCMILSKLTLNTTFDFVKNDDVPQPTFTLIDKKFRCGDIDWNYERILCYYDHSQKNYFLGRPPGTMGILLLEIIGFLFSLTSIVLIFDTAHEVFKKNY